MAVGLLEQGFLDHQVGGVFLVDVVVGSLAVVKKTSWAARKRAHSASSSLRLARGDAFHSSMRRRYSPAAKPQSVEEDSASASAISFSLAALAAELLLSSWEK